MLKEPNFAGFAADLRREQGLPMIVTRPKAKPTPKVEFPPVPTGFVHIGDAETGEQIGLDPQKLIAGRLLIQGVSGAGKSWTLRRLLEQTTDTLQQIIIDPEAEFASLAGRFGHTHIDASKLDPAGAATAAARIREHRLSVVLDLSDLPRQDQMQFVAAFLNALISTPRQHWTPALVVIDEAHIFAPFGMQGSESTAVRKASIAAVSDLMSRGRKRGLATALATQRLARLAKSVASEAQSFLIGLNVLDLDIRRAAETIGWDARRAFDRLPTLQPGDFVASGPAFTRSPAIVHIGGVLTPHRGATPALSPPQKIDATEAARLLDLDTLAEEADRDRETRGPEHAGLKAVRTYIRDPSSPLAGQIFAWLKLAYPQGAEIAALARHFNATSAQIAAATALLDLNGAVEINDDTPDRRIIRMSPTIVLR